MFQNIFKRNPSTSSATSKDREAHVAQYDFSTDEDNDDEDQSFRNTLQVMEEEEREWREKAASLLRSSTASDDGTSDDHTDDSTRTDRTSKNQPTLSVPSASASSSSGGGGGGSTKKVINRKKKVLILLTNNPKDRFQKLQQARALQMFREDGLLVDCIDESDPRSKRMLQMSSSGGGGGGHEYPQIFLEDPDGKLMFFGGYDMIEGMHAVGMLAPALGAEPIFETVIVEPTVSVPPADKDQEDESSSTPHPATTTRDEEDDNDDNVADHPSQDEHTEDYHNTKTASLHSDTQPSQQEDTSHHESPPLSSFRQPIHHQQYHQHPHVDEEVSVSSSLTGFTFKRRVVTRSPSPPLPDLDDETYGYQPPDPIMDPSSPPSQSSVSYADLLQHPQLHQPNTLLGSFTGGEEDDEQEAEVEPPSPGASKSPVATSSTTTTPQNLSTDDTDGSTMGAHIAEGLDYRLDLETEVKDHDDVEILLSPMARRTTPSDSQELNEASYWSPSSPRNGSKSSSPTDHSEMSRDRNGPSKEDGESRDYTSPDEEDSDYEEPKPTSWASRTSRVSTSDGVGGPKVLLVVSNEAKRFQFRQQERSKQFLKDHNIEYELVDDNSNIRNGLLNVSQLRRQFPQFFIEEVDGSIGFFGTYQNLEELPEFLQPLDSSEDDDGEGLEQDFWEQEDTSKQVSTPVSPRKTLPPSPKKSLMQWSNSSLTLESAVSPRRKDLEEPTVDRWASKPSADSPEKVTRQASLDLNQEEEEGWYDSDVEGHLASSKGSEQSFKIPEKPRFQESAHHGSNLEKDEKGWNDPEGPSKYSVVGESDPNSSHSSQMDQPVHDEDEWKTTIGNLNENEEKEPEGSSNHSHCSSQSDRRPKLAQQHEDSLDEDEEGWQDTDGRSNDSNIGEHGSPSNSQASVEKMSQELQELDSDRNQIGALWEGSKADSSVLQSTFRSMSSDKRLSTTSEPSNYDDDHQEIEDEQAFGELGASCASNGKTPGLFAYSPLSYTKSPDDPTVFEDDASSSLPSNRSSDVLSLLGKGHVKSQGLQGLRAANDDVALASARELVEKAARMKLSENVQSLEDDRSRKSDRSHRGGFSPSETTDQSERSHAPSKKGNESQSVRSRQSEARSHQSVRSRHSESSQKGDESYPSVHGRHSEPSQRGDQSHQSLRSRQSEPRSDKSYPSVRSRHSEPSQKGDQSLRSRQSESSQKGDKSHQSVRSRQSEPRSDKSYPSVRSRHSELSQKGDQSHQSVRSRHGEPSKEGDERRQSVCSRQSQPRSDKSYPSVRSRHSELSRQGDESHRSAHSRQSEAKSDKSLPRPRTSQSDSSHSELNQENDTTHHVASSEPIQRSDENDQSVRGPHSEASQKAYESHQSVRSRQSEPKSDKSRQSPRGRQPSRKGDDSQQSRRSVASHLIHQTPEHPVDAANRRITSQIPAFTDELDGSTREYQLKNDPLYKAIQPPQGPRVQEHLEKESDDRRNLGQFTPYTMRFGDDDDDRGDSDEDAIKSKPRLPRYMLLSVPDDESLGISTLPSKSDDQSQSTRYSAKSSQSRVSKQSEKSGPTYRSESSNRSEQLPAVLPNASHQPEESSRKSSQSSRRSQPPRSEHSQVSGHSKKLSHNFSPGSSSSGTTSDDSSRRLWRERQGKSVDSVEHETSSVSSLNHDHSPDEQETRTVPSLKHDHLSEEQETRNRTRIAPYSMPLDDNEENSEDSEDNVDRSRLSTNLQDDFPIISKSGRNQESSLSGQSRSNLSIKSANSAERSRLSQDERSRNDSSGLFDRLGKHDQPTNESPHTPVPPSVQRLPKEQLDKVLETRNLGRFTPYTKPFDDDDGESDDGGDSEESSDDVGMSTLPSKSDDQSQSTRHSVKSSQSRVSNQSEKSGPSYRSNRSKQHSQVSGHSKKPIRDLSPEPTSYGSHVSSKRSRRSDHDSSFGDISILGSDSVDSSRINEQIRQLEAELLVEQKRLAELTAASSKPNYNVLTSGEDSFVSSSTEEDLDAMIKELEAQLEQERLAAEVQGDLSQSEIDYDSDVDTNQLSVELSAASVPDQEDGVSRQDQEPIKEERLTKEVPSESKPTEVEKPTNDSSLEDEPREEERRSKDSPPENELRQGERRAKDVPADNEPREEEYEPVHADISSHTPKPPLRQNATARFKPREEVKPTKDAPVVHESVHADMSSHTSKPPERQEATAHFEDKTPDAVQANEPWGRSLKDLRLSDQEKLAARREFARRQKDKQDAELEMERKKRSDQEKQTKESHKRTRHDGAIKPGRMAPRETVPRRLGDIYEDKAVDDHPVHDLRRKYGDALRQVELLEQELTRLRRVAQELVAQLGDDERRVHQKKNHTAYSIGELERELSHERRKVRQMAKHLHENDRSFPINANGSLLTGGKHLLVEPRRHAKSRSDDSVSELSHGMDDDKAMERQIRRRDGDTQPKRHSRRDPRHNRAKKNGMGDFLYTWVPDEWANFTAYVMGIDDRLTPRR